MKSRQLARTALLIAMTTVATMVIRIPNPATQGYINLGDAMIFITGLVFGGRIGGLAGGLGSALADGLGGYFLWAPWTLVIKGIEGLLIGTLASQASQRNNSRLNNTREALILTVGGGWMVLGYFGAGALLFGPTAALTEIPGNLVQAGIGLLIALPAAAVIRRAISTEAL